MVTVQVVLVAIIFHLQGHRNWSFVWVFMLSLQIIFDPLELLI